MKTFDLLIAAVALALVACTNPTTDPADVIDADVVTDTVSGCGGGAACAEGKVCDPETGTCVSCLNDGGCGQGVCHPTKKACVGCLEDEDCSTGHCYPLAAICVQCVEDEHCAEGVCDGESLQCIGCLADEDCESGVCNPDTRSCVGCASDKTCQDDDPCTVDACQDGACTYEAVPEGDPCNDGDHCTLDETCVAGACVSYLTAPSCCEVLECDGNHSPTDTDKDGCVDACSQNSCKTHDECDEAGYCFFEPGTCGDELGLCVKKPKPCDEKKAFVCGCDGETYESACAAGTEKVSVLHEGACEVNCEPLECPEGAKPKDEDGDGCDDICVCPDETLTVSDGCDEKACESKSDCKNGFFCLKSDGLCEGVGKCAKFPEACETKENEVCGCDGEIYLSECHAHQAAVNLAEPETCK